VKLSGTAPPSYRGSVSYRCRTTSSSGAIFHEQTPPHQVSEPKPPRNETKRGTVDLSLGGGATHLRTPEPSTTQTESVHCSTEPPCPTCGRPYTTARWESGIIRSPARRYCVRRVALGRRGRGARQLQGAMEVSQVLSVDCRRTGGGHATCSIRRRVTASSNKFSHSYAAPLRRARGESQQSRRATKRRNLIANRERLRAGRRATASPD